METLTPTLPDSDPAAEVPVGWEDGAACRDLATGAFFSDDLDDIAQAKLVCLACPVRLPGMRSKR